MKVERYPKERQLDLLLNEEEGKALYNGLDRRIMKGIPMNVIEHKLWTVLREVFVEGKDEAECDDLLVRTWKEYPEDEE